MGAKICIQQKKSGKFRKCFQEKGHYSEIGRKFFSDYELWADTRKPLGRMKGELAKGNTVDAYDNDGKIMCLKGHKIQRLAIKDVNEVDIDKMIEDRYVGGFGPIFWDESKIN